MFYLLLFMLLGFISNKSQVLGFQNITASNHSITSSSPVTSSPSVTSSGCAPCLVFASEGGANILSKVIWYETPVPVTLDTVSIVLSEYKNTTITSSTTVYGDVQKLAGSAVSVQMVEASLRALFITAANNAIEMEMNNYYASMGSFVIANGTDGAVGNGVTSFAYPTPYLGINGFILYTPLTKAASSGQCLVSSAIEDAANQGQEMDVAGLGSTTIILSSTYYSPIPGQAVTGSDVGSVLPKFYENVAMDTSSFSNFLRSDKDLMSSLPILASCWYQEYGFGPPAFKLPASAMTATTTATTQIAGGVGAAVPAAPTPPNNIPPTSPVEAQPTPPSTNSPPPAAQPPKSKPSGPQNQSSPGQSSPESPQIQNPPAQNAPSQNSPPQDHPGSQDLPTGNAPSQNSPPQDQSPQNSPSQGNDAPNLVSPPNPGSPNQVSNGPTSSQGEDVSANGNPAAPVVSYAGGEVQPDKSTQYNFPGIGTLQPGGSPVTANNVVFSLAPSASAIVSNGIPQPLTPVANKPVGSPQPPTLTIGNVAYTADSSSNFVIGSQTLAPGSPSITVFGSPISLASDGSVAVIGSSTIHLNPAPTSPPTFTFNGATYTATTSSAFIIGSQTLLPGGSITVSNTPIIYPTTGNAIIVGSSTQSLSSSGSSPTLPVMTFAGSAITADSASAFEIAGQTLTKGGVVTISGTPVSYAGNGGDVVVGSSTEGLGGVIMSGFGGEMGGARQTESANANGTVFQGNAQGQRNSNLSSALGALIAGLVGLVML